MKVKKGDTVLVLAGKDKGAKGQVIAAFPRSSACWSRASNRIRAHPYRCTQRGAQQGGIVTQEAPIHVSNVMVIDSEDKPTRSGTARTTTAATCASRGVPVRTSET